MFSKDGFEIYNEDYCQKWAMSKEKTIAAIDEETLHKEKTSEFLVCFPEEANFIIEEMRKRNFVISNARFLGKESASKKPFGAMLEFVKTRRKNVNK